MPSAGRPFTTELITRLVAGGVLVAPIVLHTGVSSQERHERPYAERYRVPEQTARLVNAVHGWGGRVIATGTTVVRALETVARADGVVAAGEGWTNLIVTPERGSPGGRRPDHRPARARVVAPYDAMIRAHRRRWRGAGRGATTPARASPVIRPSTARTPRSGVTIRFVQPSPAATTPSAPATVSSARTTVVPVAITRPPQAWTALTRRAVCSGTW